MKLSFFSPWLEVCARGVAVGTLAAGADFIRFLLRGKNVPVMHENTITSILSK